jgi:hypothetical protein
MSYACEMVAGVSPDLTKPVSVLPIMDSSAGGIE